MQKWSKSAAAIVYMNILQSGPERSRQSNLAVFIVEGGLDAKFPHIK